MQKDRAGSGQPNSTVLSVLGIPAFRRIWLASLLSNFCYQTLGIAAGWEMTQLSSDPSMVAFVQTALMLPLTIVSIPAGALADMIDRRKVAIAGLLVSMLAGSILAIASWTGLLTPRVLLAGIALLGSGVALYQSAWQSSIGDLVPNKQLPSAISLNATNYNLARSFGPALGGVLLLSAGISATFSINAIGYLPLLLAFLFWHRVATPSRLPRDSFMQVTISGFRYAFHATGVRNPVARGFAMGFTGSASIALAPLVVRTQLGGDASMLGLLLGAAGVGAFFGSLIAKSARERFGPERTVQTACIMGGLAMAGIGMSTELYLALPFYLMQGCASIIAMTVLNIGVQLSALRLVTARALSLYTASLTGGLAIGAVAWGNLIKLLELQSVILISGALYTATATLRLILPLRLESGTRRERFVQDSETQF